MDSDSINWVLSTVVALFPCLNVFFINELAAATLLIMPLMYSFMEINSFKSCLQCLHRTVRVVRRHYKLELTWRCGEVFK